ncbi:MAG: TIGR03032 family protein [Bacteroidota bacterium]
MNPPAPFSCTYTPNIPELLTQLGCTIAITTYQAGKLIFISPNGINQLMQLPRDFRKAMGLAVEGRRMAIATKDEVIVLADASGLAKNYPIKPNTYDALFLPRAVYHVGMVDIHDMDWDNQGKLWAVNTRFSCLSVIDDHYSFTPKWKPPFITQFEPVDFCHLNGMCMVEGLPKYVTMFGQTTTPKGWRDGVQTNGLIMDVPTGEIVAANLPMPHSPRWMDGNLYCLLSATGEVVKVDVESGKYDVITKLDGFVRGMAKWGDYLFVGMSRLRQNASTFRDLPIAQKAIYCGVEIIHLPTGARVGNIRYQASVEELYDIQIIHKMRPGILNHLTDKYRAALNTPQFDYWSESQPERGSEQYFQ